MARPTLTMMRAAVVVALASRAVAQTCYYPNGNPAPDSEKPCSSAQGSACCPDTWECLDNGLCHLPTNNLYGRYSCTDKDWNSPGCPSNMCTYGGTAFGAEGIEQCSNHNNNWCCNADRTNVNCCQESPSPRPFFQLQDGKAYATIGRNQASSAPTLSSITGLASGSASAAASRTSAPASSGRVSSASRAVSSASPVTSIQTSVSSGPAGVVTIERTTVITPTSVPNNDGGSATTSGGSSSNIGVIVGCAVGIPMALALFGVVFWLLRKRRQQKVNPYKNEADGDSTNSPGMAAAALRKFGKKDVYRHSRPGTAEIDGNPAGPGRPVSEIPGHAELESGAGFRPGHGSAYAPDTVGIGGGNTEGRSTWGSPPPTYSPGTNSTAFPAAVELDGSSSLPAINEKTEAPQQYQAYRPPQAAELPTAKTPPEDLEKQLQK